jgi:hypothetical protein
LTHTLQQGAESRLSRTCATDLKNITIPAGDSELTADAFVNLASVPITSNITASPLAGNFHVRIRVPRELQRLIAPGFLKNTNIKINISADIASKGASSLASLYATNEICLYVTFYRGKSGRGTSQNWYAALRILRGTNMRLPVQTGAGTPLRIAPPSRLGIGAYHITLGLKNDLTSSVGPFQINSLGDLKATWSGIRKQVRNVLAKRIQDIQIPINLRARGSLTVPVPLPGGVSSGVIPVGVLGDIRLSTQVSSRKGRFMLRLGGSATGTTAAGMITLELWGHGHLRGRIPSSIRLGDLRNKFLQNLLRSSEGKGEIRGRLRAFGIPGRVNASFRLRQGQFVGKASFLTPFAMGGGTFRYSVNKSLSATLGMLGIVRLTLAPAEKRLSAEPQQKTGPAPYKLGTSVVGLGATGMWLTPSAAHTLSAGFGPQFIQTPEGRKKTGA